MVLLPRYKCRKLEYNRKQVLKALALYHRRYSIQQTPTMYILYSARDDFGMQFLIDMFVATEEFIYKYHKYNMAKAREDITKVMNNIPNFAVLYEN